MPGREPTVSCRFSLDPRGNAVTDDPFEPRPGRIGNRGRRPRTYARKVLAAAKLHGIKSGARNHRFDGSRIGRGAGMGRLLGTRAVMRRVIVKTHLVRLAPRTLAAAHAHLRYIQRDGVTREGLPGTLYSSREEIVDGRAFAERCAGDRHQFRIIVSPEDGDLMPDLKPFIRRLMTQVETDLGTQLDWVAVDHFNTGQPHTHLLLRGVDDRGDNLVIAREYIAHGFRARAAELLTLDLGPRTIVEIEQRLRRDIGQDRFTAIDRDLVRRMDEGRRLVATDRDPFRQSLVAGRLKHLSHLGLANDRGGGVWQLSAALEPTLRQMGERGDIIRTLQREMTRRHLEGREPDHVIADRVHGPAAPVEGLLLARGLADELRDRHYLIVDGIDGRVHYIEIGRGGETEPLPDEAIVRVARTVPQVRPADRTITMIAAANQGRYSEALHILHDSSAGAPYIAAHIRRLEALRRAGLGPERHADGSWTIPADFEKRAIEHAARTARDRPVTVEVLSSVPLERLPRADAATWLDRTLAEGPRLPIRDTGFGLEVMSALRARGQWLIDQQLADAEGDRVRLRVSALARLQRREIERAGGDLAESLDKSFVEAPLGKAVDGRLTRRIDLMSGRFALIETEREFSLVPWKRSLERQIGKEIGGIVREDGFSWRRGRARGLER